MRVTLIHNPGAGGKRGMDAAALEALLGDAGHEVRYQSSKEEGWKKALKRPADLVVVAGGDGTVGRVARRMVGRGIPVALLPSGTANNIARTLGQTERPFEDLIRGWSHARRVKLDVGIARGPWGERYFIEGVGLGLFASLLAGEDDKNRKGRRRDVVNGALRRLHRAAERYEAVEVAAVLDGKDISGRYLLLEALNLPHVGPNLFLAPDSERGSGHFDVVLAKETERDRLLEYLKRWQENRARLAVLPSLRGRRLEIEWTGFELHIDDKLKPGKGAEPKEVAGIVEVRDRGDTVEFLVPDGASKRAA